MTVKEKIIAISDELLTHLLIFKKNNPDFTCSLRSRDSVQSDDVRLEKGQWFQGSDYIYVPLFKKGDNARKVKTIGFVITFSPNLEIENNYIEISFKRGSESEADQSFHKELAKELDIKLDNTNVGRKYYENPKRYLENLDNYLTKVRSIALGLLEKYNINSSYIISEQEFQKRVKKIETIKKQLRNTVNTESNKMLYPYIKALQYKKQVILQGPPGTGKTYTAKDIAEEMIYGSVTNDKKIQKLRLEDSEQFELVQFHPSYSYEDFVRGITAKNEEGTITYDTENKVLARFADKAYNNVLSSKKDTFQLSREQKIFGLLSEFAEKIQVVIEEEGAYRITESVAIVDVEEDAFRYTGAWKASQRMKFVDIVLGANQGASSRQEFKKTEGISGLGVQHATYYFKVLELFMKDYRDRISIQEIEEVVNPELKNYVLIIDEINRANLPSVLGELIYGLEYRGEKVSSMYALDKDNALIIPDNLYIIGTMNTADRSVGHIDYAIKRRFAFIDMLPSITAINSEKGKELFRQVSQLFVKEDEEGNISNSIYLAPDFDYKEVQLGHSYFIADEFTLRIRLQYEIIPILNEYVKDGLLLETAKEEIQKIAAFEC